MKRCFVQKIFKNCGPLTVFLPLKLIVWPAHWSEFDMPTLVCRETTVGNHCPRLSNVIRVECDKSDVR